MTVRIHEGGGGGRSEGGGGGGQKGGRGSYASLAFVEAWNFL